MAARITDGSERLRGDDEASVVVTDVDGDPEAEPVAAPDTAADAAADEELARLDAGDASPVELPDDIGLVDLFGDLDCPTPPLTAPHEISLLEELKTGLGHALTDIERRGLDIELSGALRVLTFFSFGLSAAIEAEAADRGVNVVIATD